MSNIRKQASTVVLAVSLLLVAAPQVEAKKKGYTASQQEIVSIIRDVFPDHVEARAIRIARCESGLRARITSPRNKNGTRDHGVFQFNDGGTMQSYGLSGGRVFNARLNIQAAYRLWRDSGGSFKRWACNRKV
jgi:hypothetical protein